MAITAKLSITTLKVDGLNSQVQRYRVAEWILKKGYREAPSLCCLQRLASVAGTHGLGVAE